MCSAGGKEVVLADPPLLNDHGLLFESYAGWTQDVGTVKLELKKEQGLLRDELPRLQMTVRLIAWGLCSLSGK